MTCYIMPSYENQIICTPGTAQQKPHYQCRFFNYSKLCEDSCLP